MKTKAQLLAMTEKEIFSAYNRWDFYYSHLYIRKFLPLIYSVIISNKIINILNKQK